MCIGDWRLGRLIRSEAKTFTPGIGGIVTLGRNMQRVGLLVSSQSVLNITTQNIQIAVDGIIVGLLTLGEHQRLYTFLEHGDLSTRSWTITTPVAANVVSTVEFFLPEKYIAAALEEFERSLRL